ncbi:MAG: FAD-dependent oxidoreductase, partial [Exiguobacterium sp.]|nr:FAD-dependent oxidoreductase [Exiguobacterium sp.]
MKRPNIVILGAGFGGLITAVNLQKTLAAGDANITLINKYDYHYQTTWLHEPAAGTMNPDQARIYINDIVNPSRVKLVKGIVDRVDTAAKQVT